jgi:hypothetical protein
VHGERLKYSVLDRLGVAIGEGVLSTDREGDGWLFDQIFESTPADSAPNRDTSTVATTAEMLPLWSERVIDRADAPESYRFEYDHEAEEGISLVTRDGDEERREVRLRTPVYDNESSVWLWRTLELGEGFEARYVSLSPLDRSQQTVSLAVTDRVEVEVPAGTFETWRLQVRSGRATGVAWIEVAAPHRVVLWDNGATTLRLEADETASP